MVRVGLDFAFCVADGIGEFDGYVYHGAPFGIDAFQVKITNLTIIGTPQTF